MATPSMRIDAGAIHHERMLRAWSLRELAAIAGVSVSGLSRALTTGAGSTELLKRVHAAFEANEPIEGMERLLRKEREAEAAYEAGYKAAVAALPGPLREMAEDDPDA